MTATPIPPAPSFGAHWPVMAGERCIGSTVEIHAAAWVPVCARCRAHLTARPTHRRAERALQQHWTTTHPSVAA